MRTVTTEASRSFGALLDQVEQGETVVVTRRGRGVARIGPAYVVNGTAVLALLRSAPIDDSFGGRWAAAWLGERRRERS